MHASMRYNCFWVKKGFILAPNTEKTANSTLYKTPTLKSTKFFLLYSNTAPQEKGDDIKTVAAACRISGLIPRTINPGKPNTVVPIPTQPLINPDTLPKSKEDSIVFIFNLTL